MYMNDKQTRFQERFPEVFFLTSDQPEQLVVFLRSIGWMEVDEVVAQIEKPGEGNMNYVLRVKTDRQSFIVKQSRPWVEKYPQLDAPIERIIVEAQFYDALSEVAPLAGYIPALKGFKAEHYLMALEDLGKASDFTSIYQKSESLAPEELADLIRFLSELHQITPSQLRDVFPDNQSLKKLNAEHLFTYPFQLQNGFDLETVQVGLQDLSLPYKQNAALKIQIEKLGEVYLAEGDVLIHGDYYPGSWLRTPEGTRVIDPEFAYLGRPEFDLAVLVAHLKMAQTGEAVLMAALNAYRQPKGFDQDLFAGFCGVEIMRRIIGLAQLPLDLTLEEKGQLLAWAAASVVNPTTNSYLRTQGKRETENLVTKRI